jgi:hypothetical protein
VGQLVTITKDKELSQTCPRETQLLDAPIKPEEKYFSYPAGQTYAGEMGEIVGLEDDYIVIQFDRAKLKFHKNDVEVVR